MTKRRSIYLRFGFLRVILAHGADQDCVGKDSYSVADVDGKMFNRDIVDRANGQGHGMFVEVDKLLCRSEK